MFIELNSVQEIQNYLNENKSVVLDFYADWCPPCKKLLPIFMRVSEQLKFIDIIFVKVNVDLFPDLSGDYSITSIPTLILLKPKTEIKKLVGFQEEEQLIEAVNSHFFA